MDKFKNIHETQPSERPVVTDDNSINNSLNEIQRIEGGGPPRKIDFKSMPAPVRLFGYFFILVMVLMMLFLIGISIFK
jgi:hypothetical protein